MPRALRVQYPGAIYHVMNRGDRRERIFLDDVGRQDWLKTLAEARWEPEQSFSTVRRLGHARAVQVADGVFVANPTGDWLASSRPNG